MPAYAPENGMRQSCCSPQIADKIRIEWRENVLRGTTLRRWVSSQNAPIQSWSDHILPTHTEISVTTHAPVKSKGRDRLTVTIAALNNKACSIIG